MVLKDKSDKVVPDGPAAEVGSVSPRILGGEASKRVLGKAMAVVLSEEVNSPPSGRAVELRKVLDSHWSHDSNVTTRDVASVVFAQAEELANVFIDQGVNPANYS